jgi:hypothetical protein
MTPFWLSSYPNRGIRIGDLSLPSHPVYPTTLFILLYMLSLR